MENRFLFRGRCPHTGKWYVGYLMTSRDGYHSPYKMCIMHDKGNGERDPWRIVSIDPSTVGQCIGVSVTKSYRGGEPEDLLLYEGDIIRIYDDNNTYDTAIFWSNSKLSYMYVNPYGVHESLEEILSCDLGHPINCAEIIGTIHDKERSV